MRKVICLLGLMLCVSLTASAQDSSKIDIFGGFNYTRFSGAGYLAPGDTNYNAYGFTASVAYNIRHWAAVVGEISYADSSSVPGIGNNSSGYTFSYMVGPKVIPFHLKHGITPFAQVLLGGIHPGGSLGLDNTGFIESFAMAAGGGVDWNISKRFAVRLAQVDYLMTRFGYQNPGTPNQNNFRYSGGIVIRLGSGR
jgi:hypothetical protein